MTYYPVTNIQFANSSSIDAFARLRVATPQTIFDSATLYDQSDSYWEFAATGGGSTAHSQNRASVELAVNTSNGALALRQTRQYFPYQPGKSQLVVMTGNFGTPVNNCVKRWGYFDSNNGLFFEMNGDGLAVVQRSKEAGVVVDTKIYQSNWNIDTLVGSGVSQFNLDTSKANIYIIDMEWLGVGRTRFGVYTDDGIPTYAHAFKNANSNTGVYMSTASLPIRFEISNTGAISNSTSIYTICSAVIAEGGFEEARSYSRTTYSSTAAGGHSIPVGAPLNVLAIRPLTSFHGSVNRGYAYLTGVELMVQTAPIYWELVWNPSVTGLNSSWSAVGDDSLMEASTGRIGSTSAGSGGIVITSGYSWAGGTGVNARGGEETGDVLTRLPLTVDRNGVSSIPLSLRVTTIGATPAVVHAALKWREIGRAHV